MTLYMTVKIKSSDGIPHNLMLKAAKNLSLDVDNLKQKCCQKLLLGFWAADLTYL